MAGFNRGARRARREYQRLTNGGENRGATEVTEGTERNWVGGEWRGMAGFNRGARREYQPLTIDGFGDQGIEGPSIRRFGGGLRTLPPWVRGLDRVTRWVTAKIAIYHARLRCRSVAS